MSLELQFAKQACGNLLDISGYCHPEDRGPLQTRSDQCLTRSLSEIRILVASSWPQTLISSIQSRRHLSHFCSGMFQYYHCLLGHHNAKSYASYYSDKAGSTLSSCCGEKLREKQQSQLEGYRSEAGTCNIAICTLFKTHRCQFGVARS